MPKTLKRVLPAKITVSWLKRIGRFTPDEIEAFREMYPDGLAKVTAGAIRKLRAADFPINQLDHLYQLPCHCDRCQPSSARVASDLRSIQKAPRDA